MAIQNSQTPAPVDVSNTVRIESASLTAIKAEMPVISVGDIINLTVRQNQGGEQGLLFFQGQLIPATMPDFYQQGDKLVAKVMYDAEQIVFKILSHQTPHEAEQQIVTQKLETQLKQLMSTSTTSILSDLGLKLVEPDTGEKQRIAPDSPLAKFLQTAIQEAMPEIVTDRMLSNPEEFTKTVRVMLETSSSSNIREFANRLKEVLSSTDNSVFQKTYESLFAVRAKLVDIITREPETAIKTLFQLVDSIKKDADQAVPKSKEQAFLQAAAQTLEQAQKNPESIIGTVDRLLQQLEIVTLPTKDGEIKRAPDLQQLVTRLENLASAQESLNQLNPIFQAFGEPVTILFPFVLHGMLNQGKVNFDVRDLIDPDAEKNEEKKIQHSRKGLHHLQLTVPLPALGTVGVELAHSENEILARFTVESDEAGAFLLEQLEHLALVFKEQGYEKAEFVASVTSPSVSQPPQTQLAHARIVV